MQAYILEDQVGDIQPIVENGVGCIGAATLLTCLWSIRSFDSDCFASTPLPNRGLSPISVSVTVQNGISSSAKSDGDG